ncbi:MAG TPA: hypothetical protein VFL56_06870 [Solirubrobacterales bacterium]|nr:hypothetical protein [Solirubrobacterales bacterium]
MRGGSDDPRARESATRKTSQEPLGSGQSGPGESGGQPSEEELRAQLEEEIKRVRVEDVVLQSVVSILNLSARRIAKDDERDLEQAKVGIDAARALVDLVKPDAQAQLRQAISELQVLYAKHAGEGGGEAANEPSEQPETASREGSSSAPKRDSGLWTPPGS